MYVFFEIAEVDVESVQWGEKRAERRALSHLSEGVDILREALAAVAAIAIRPRHVGVHVVDVVREQDAYDYPIPQLSISQSLS